jgi:hypothetical protein
MIYLILFGDKYWVDHEVIEAYLSEERAEKRMKELEKENTDKEMIYVIEEVPIAEYQMFTNSNYNGR